MARYMGVEEKEFEQKVLQLFRANRTSKITSGIISRSRRDLAAGAAVEDRMDEIQELFPAIQQNTNQRAS